MTASRQALKNFLEDSPATSLPLTASEENELFREGLLGIACRQRQLKEAFMEGVAREFRWRELLDELDAALAGQGRHALVFKGGALLGKLYPTGSRPVSDLDLLGDEHLPAVLESLGFQSLDGHSWIWRRGLFQLDLHQHPLGRLQYAFPWDLRRARQLSQPLTERRGLFRFQREDETLIALIHAGKHAYSRFIWLADIQLLLKQCRPQQLDSILVEAQATRYLTYARWLLAQVADRPAPALSPLERLLLQLCLRRATSESLGMLLPLLSISSPRRALHYMWQCLRPQNGGDWSLRARELWNLARLFKRSSTPPASPP